MKSYEIRAMDEAYVDDAHPGMSKLNLLTFIAKMLQEIAAQLAERNEASNG